jgi:hypothetical protein
MIRSTALTVALFALLAPPASGAGGPVAGSDAGRAGVTGRGIAARYLARPAGDGTLLLAVERRGGAIVKSRFLHDRLVVPAVAYDGSATGLSADGGTLVLAAPREFSRRPRSHFTIFDAPALRRRAVVDLRGDFTLDALSPDGSRLYLIESQSRDGTRYAVRAYDVAARRLLPDPIVDPAEADEPMRGIPISRAMSPGGRWAYTLYDGGGGPHPFIHALDTERGRAKCIDLDDLDRDASYGMVLRVGRDGRIDVRPIDGVASALTVDPRSFAVREPRDAPAPAPAPAAASEGGAPGWLWPAAGVVVLALLAALAVRAGGTPASRRSA